MHTLILAMSLFGAGIDCSTDELPAALQQACVTRLAVVDSRSAHAVRGQAFASFNLSQTLGWSVTGTAAGTTTLSEGVLGSWLHQGLHTNTSSQTLLETQGTFAGLAGWMGTNGNPEVGPMGLQFDIGGKALQQAINFGGTFSQNFSQSFGR